MSAVEALVGRSQPEITVEVERGRLRDLARAIGETDPVYTDVEAARAAGHPDLLAGPTALFGIDLELSDTLGFLAAAGVDLSRVLHGEQRFSYHRDVHAGDTLTFRSSFVDSYTKSDGALEFLVRRTGITRGGEPVADLESVSVIRTGGRA